MKEAKKVIAKIIKVECPYCGEELTDWLQDPRGTKDKCDYCDKEFSIAADAEVVVRN